MTNHIVLFEPLFPANTGNIARTCAGTDTVLHLIKPLGFSTDDKHMKRAGLDYWDKVKVVYHDDLVAFLDSIDLDHLYIASKFAERDYSEVDYTIAGDHYFLFGKETTGLPEVSCAVILKKQSEFLKMTTTSGRSTCPIPRQL